MTDQDSPGLEALQAAAALFQVYGALPALDPISAEATAALQSGDIETFKQEILKQIKANPNAWINWVQRAMHTVAETRTRAIQMQDEALNVEKRNEEIQAYDDALVAENTMLNNEVTRLATALKEEQTAHEKLKASQRSTADASFGQSIEIPNPPPFSGQRDEFRDWWSQVHNKLTGNADRFITEHQRISYIYKLCAGNARAQLAPYLNSKGGWSFKSVKEVKDILEAAFGDTDTQGTAMRKLLSLRQTNQTFQEYYAEFQRLATLSKFEPIALKGILEMGLSHELSKMMITQPDLGDMTLKEYAARCQLMDIRMQRLLQRDNAEP